MRADAVRTSDADAQPLYPEDAQALDIKSEAFYDEHAAKRQYFYYIDLQGRLFLEDTLPKNIATSLKSGKFLDFFWRMLRPNSTGLHEEYPLYSPCGKEKNFIKAADTGIVFTELLDAEREAEGSGAGGSKSPTRAFDDDDDGLAPLDSPLVLRYAASLSVPFHPSRLRMSESGRLYHSARGTKVGGYALVHTHLAGRLSEHIDATDDPGSSGSALTFVWEGSEYPLELVADDKVQEA